MLGIINAGVLHLHSTASSAIRLEMCYCFFSFIYCDININITDKHPKRIGALNRKQGTRKTKWYIP